MQLYPIRLDIDPLEASPLPVDLTLIKSHLSVDYADQDDLIENYLLAAIISFEDTTHRTIISRSHRWVLRDFPTTIDQAIRLPRGKTRSVASISYVVNGSTVTLTGPSSSPAGTDWLEDLRGDDGGLLMPTQGGTWPTVDYDHPTPVAITFTAGWLASELPPNVLNALLFYVRSKHPAKAAGVFA